MSFTCPVCSMTSHSPADEAAGYCGACHDFTGLAPDPFFRAVRLMHDAIEGQPGPQEAMEAASAAAERLGELVARYTGVQPVRPVLAGLDVERVIFPAGTDFAVCPGCGDGHTLYPAGWVLCMHGRRGAVLLCCDEPGVPLPEITVSPLIPAGEILLVPATDPRSGEVPLAGLARRLAETEGLISETAAAVGEAARAPRIGALQVPQAEPDGSAYSWRPGDPEL